MGTSVRRTHLTEKPRLVRDLMDAPRCASFTAREDDLRRRRDDADRDDADRSESDLSLPSPSLEWRRGRSLRAVTAVRTAPQLLPLPGFFIAAG
jgi:hypothetical protein